MNIMNITNIIWDVMYIQYDMMSRDGGAVMITFQDRMVSIALIFGVVDGGSTLQLYCTILRKAGI